MKRHPRGTVFGYKNPKAMQRYVGAMVAALLAGLLVACGSPSQGGRSATAGTAALQDVHSVYQLQELFNRDGGKPRLVLLVSPT